MTLEEAITHARETTYRVQENCSLCAEEHEQLANWLEELRNRREEEKEIQMTNKEAIITLEENELYQEIGLFADGNQIGEAEVEIKSKMLSRLSIYPPYQDRGYGTEIVRILTGKYCCNNLWVNADNARAIRVYEKNGYTISSPKMYLMERSDSDD